jgi:gluconolactonase
MTKLTTFSQQLGFIEGPALNAQGELCLVSISHGCVYVLNDSGVIVKSIRTGGGPNGLATTAEAMFVAQNGGIFGASGKARPGIQKIEGNRVRYEFDNDFAAPNDLCFGPDGRLYVSDPITDRAVFEPIQGQVWACDPTSGECEVVIADRLFPNGLAFDRSGKYFYLTQTYSRVVERFSFTAGRLESDGVLCQLANGRPDGMAIDMEGNLWVCTPGTGGVEVFSSSGVPITRIEFGAGTMTTNCCFGGPNADQLFVTAAGTGSVLRMTSPAPGLSLLPFRSL